ncbi:MAG: hypothetical protein CMD35_08405 [Flavobacteriales bacterium]|nr:hypothetical protein [Flavobacteriales bacterium]
MRVTENRDLDVEFQDVLSHHFDERRREYTSLFDISSFPHRETVVAITRLKRATCDLFIYGPTPHSIKGKSINDSWEELDQTGSVFIRGYQKKPLSKTNLIKWLNEFCNYWCMN